MKHHLLALALFLLPCCLMAQVRVAVNGEEPMAFGTEGGIYFHNDTLTIAGATQTLTLPMDEARVLVFDLQQLAVQAAEEGEALAVYPTPAHSTITLRGIGSERQEARVYTLQGAKVLSRTVANGESLNVEVLPAGEYLLRCGNHTVKFIKL